MAIDATADDTPESIELELGVFEGVVDEVDSVSIARALGSALPRLAVRPKVTIPAAARFGSRVALAGIDVGRRTVRGDLREPVPIDRSDSRFRDVAWAQNPAFRLLLEAYLATTALADELVAGADLDEVTEAKAQFAARFITDVISPTNFPLTNPVVLKRALETGGVSLVRGVRNAVTDAIGNEGWPRQVDGSKFELGRDLAPSRGKVVFRNELIELLQYDPETPEVHEIPLLVCPPWINRYYIADLAPGKSLVEWAVAHGHATFAISYRNPDESMRELTFDDYVRLGPLTAIDVVRSITGCDVTNMLSICLGGTLTTMALAYLDAVGDHLVNSSTLLNSAVDYSQSGLLGDVFADRGAINSICRRMDSEGFLDAKHISRTFSLLKANDLVFRYLVDGWLLGEDPPVFDLLAWNADGTRLPGRAHGTFLRSMYLENALASGTMTVMEEPLVLSSISPEHYVVAALDDHIVPWRASYRTTQLIKAPTRFVITRSGHIGGIVSPPGPKAKVWASDSEELPPDPDAWMAAATVRPESWWEDWARWIGGHAGELRAPYDLGSDAYPVLGDAPGTYVRS